MSDICYLEITFRKKDREKFLSFMGYRGNFPEETEEGTGQIMVTDNEASYAHQPELKTLALEGVPFYGQHGEGGSYTSGVFASAEGAFANCDALGSDPAVPIGEDGIPNPELIAGIQKYWQVLRRAKELVEEED